MEVYVVYLGPNLQKVMMNCVLFCFCCFIFMLHMQKSTVTPEEKAIPGSASGQDGKPGFKSRADGRF